MFLFFGTRPGKKTEQRFINVTCSFCKQEGTLNLVSQPNYFHLFWLPLFKTGTYRYAECSHCKRVYYQDGFTSEMTRKIKNL